MADVVIVSAARTPVGSLRGSLSGVPAHALGATAVTAALSRAHLAPGEADELVMGQVLAADAGMNPARQTAIAAGLPVERTALTVNQVCGSGLRAVALGRQSILAGDSEIVVAGGQECMSQAPHCVHVRNGQRMGDASLIDTMIRDGLWDAFNGYHMGITAENVARDWQISRDEQDAFALASQKKAGAAQAEGRFRDEIAPVALATRKRETIVDTDEHPRPDSSAESLARLKPAFAKDGSVTAGNASGVNDGAAAVVLMRARTAERRGLTPLARIAGWATSGVDPRVMGIGPVPATRKALGKAGWTTDDLDLIEANEAFAAQTLAVGRELGWSAERVNVNGGAIALGHPIGASGARILVTLLYEMRRREARKGLATVCIGGGMGVTMLLERPA